MFCAKDMIDVPANCTTDSVVCTSLNSQTQNLLPPLSGSCTLVLCCKVQCLQVVQLSWQLATDSYSISMYFCLLLCASPGKFEHPSFLIVSSHSSGFFVFFWGDQWSVTGFFFVYWHPSGQCGFAIRQAGPRQPWMEAEWGAPGHFGNTQEKVVVQSS